MPPTSPAPELLFSPGMMRTFLLLGQLAMIVLALAYLRRRQLSLFGYLKWGLLAVLVPLVGPFLVIYTHPGSSQPHSEFTPLPPPRGKGLGEGG